MSQEEKNIKDLLTNVLRNKSRLSRKYQSYNVEQIFRDTMGEMISSYTTRVQYQNGTLTLYISSAPLKQELLLTKESIITKMNKVLEYCQVDKVVIR